MCTTDFVFETAKLLVFNIFRALIAISHRVIITRVRANHTRPVPYIPALKYNSILKFGRPEDGRFGEAASVSLCAPNYTLFDNSITPLYM